MEHTLRAHVQVAEQLGPRRVKVEGRQRKESDQSLFKELVPALALEDYPSVTIDLRGITLFDSAGLRSLEGYISHHPAAKNQTEFSLTGLVRNTHQRAACVQLHGTQVRSAAALPLYENAQDGAVK